MLRMRLRCGSCLHIVVFVLRNCASAGEAVLRTALAVLHTDCAAEALTCGAVSLFHRECVHAVFACACDASRICTSGMLSCETARGCLARCTGVFAYGLRCGCAHMQCGLSLSPRVRSCGRAAEWCVVVCACSAHVFCVCACVQCACIFAYGCATDVSRMRCCLSLTHSLWLRAQRRASERRCAGVF